MFKMTVKLFISHSERDQRFAAPLEEWLRTGLDLSENDIRCTSVNPLACDADNLGAAQVLKEDLLSARFVIGLLSTNSLGSHWAQMEMGAAWVKDRLYSVRVPGMRHNELPPPHDDLSVSRGYCDERPMQRLMEKIAEDLEREVQHTANQKLTEIIESAKEMLKADAVCWFSLPVFLSAYRIDPDTYGSAYHDLTEKLNKSLNLPDEYRLEDRLKSCVTDDGVIVGEPEALPRWAQGHWKISREVVNFMLVPSSKSPHDLDVPSVLPAKMIAEMKSALGAGKDRSSRIQKWFENAEEYLSTNSPIERDSHSGSRHP